MVEVKTLEKQYNDLIKDVSAFAQARVESNMKVEKPFEKLHDELHVDMMTDISKRRFEWWTIGYDGDIQLKGNFETPYFVESTDKFWRLILFKDEKVDSENLFGFYMNEVLRLSKTLFAFGTMDSPLSFNTFIQSFYEDDYDKLHDIFWLASLQVRKLKENDLPWLLQASDMLKSYVDRTASESCFDFVFGD
jgi:hypothetical protein